MSLLPGERIVIRPMVPEDAEARLEMVVRNREFWGRYQPSWSHEQQQDTVEVMREKIVQAEEAMKKDRAYYFGIYTKDSEQLIGVIMLAQIMREALQSGILGYLLDEAHNGKGYATEAAVLMCRYAFEELGLHRLEAGVMPSNVGSWRVLEKAGFVREGLERKKLMINGVWEDHYLYSMLETDWEARKSKSGAE